jgi:transposase
VVESPPMDNSLSKQATDWREGRRFRAFELKQEGWSQQCIADALGVSKGAVSQWMKRARDGGGVQALKRRPAPGARPRLSEEQRHKVPELLERGAEAHGFRGEVWTCERVAEVIRREFGVSYHPAHVSRLLKALRQSLQKPKRRAEQRDEEAIERWKDKKWPSLKKGPSRRAGR